MAQRHSGYARRPRDAYQTPPWVTLALLRHLLSPRRRRLPSPVWEPAAGEGLMVAALRGRGLRVLATDLATGRDFLRTAPDRPPPAIITNPPFRQAEAFVRRAIELTEPCRGLVAVLVPLGFDSARGRSDLFLHPAFCKKVVLTRRIVWFERAGAAPSSNHCWLVWDWRHEGPPTVAYEAGENPVARRGAP